MLFPVICPVSLTADLHVPAKNLMRQFGTGFPDAPEAKLSPLPQILSSLMFFFCPKQITFSASAGSGTLPGLPHTVGVGSDRVPKVGNRMWLTVGRQRVAKKFADLRQQPSAKKSPGQFTLVPCRRLSARTE